MLDVEEPKHGLWVDITFDIDRSRPEWVALTPEYWDILAKCRAYSYDASSLDMKAETTFGLGEFPLLVPAQYPNVTQTRLSPIAGHTLAYFLYEHRNDEIPLIISGSRVSVILALASLYPVLYLYSSTVASLSGFGEAVNAMLEFIHKDLSTTRQGVLHAYEETIIHG